MMRITYLFTIDARFCIPSRGVILVPDRVAMTRYHVGQRIELCRPDGTTLQTVIHGVESLNFAIGTPPECQVRPIVVAEELAQEAIPVGTDVWLLEDP